MNLNYALRLQYEGIHAEIAYYESQEDSEIKTNKLQELKTKAASLVEEIKETNNEII